MKTHSCSKCEKEFYTKQNLMRHMENVFCKGNDQEDKLPLVISETVEQKNMIECEYCYKLFPKQTKLTRHLQSVKGDCYRIRNGIDDQQRKTIIKKQKVINKIITHNYQNINQNNVTNIAIQPIVKQITLAKHGKETISHITKEMMLELLALESFTKMSTQLAKLLYFNDDVPENKNWTIVYPRNKKAGLELNEDTNMFERVLTEKLINSKFTNMIGLFLPMVEEIDQDDRLLNNLSWRQRSNIKKFTSYFGITNISEEAKYIYDSIKEMAFNERSKTTKTWKEGGREGNHLSLKF